MRKEEEERIEVVLLRCCSKSTSSSTNSTSTLSSSTRARPAMPSSSPPPPPPSHLSFQITHKGAAHVAVYNSGSSYILSGGADRTIKLTNAKTGVQVKVYGGHGYEVLGIAWSVAFRLPPLRRQRLTRRGGRSTRDNTRFASCGGDRNVFLWDVASGDIVRRLSGHNGKINTVAWNDSASVLASGSCSSSFLSLFPVLKSFFSRLVRHYRPVMGYQVRSPSILLPFSAPADSPLFHRSNNRIPLQVLEDSKDSITSIRIDDHLVHTGSVDGYVRTYDLRMGQLKADFFDRTWLARSLSLPSHPAVSVSTPCLQQLTTPLFLSRRARHRPHAPLILPAPASHYPRLNPPPPRPLHRLRHPILHGSQKHVVSLSELCGRRESGGECGKWR